MGMGCGDMTAIHSRMMNRRSVLALALCGALSCAAQGGIAPRSQRPAHPELLVSAAWLAGHLHDPHLVILCIAQNPAFYTEGHIPGARFLPLEELTAEQGNVLHGVPPIDSLRAAFENAGVSDDSRVVLYGERLGLLAARAFFTLDFLGQGNHAALLDGGLEAWKLEKLPLTTEVTAREKGKFTPKPAREVLVDLDAMRSLSREAASSSSLALLDARPPEEFSGARLSQDVSRGGHIPGAACLYWMNTLVSRENPVLKPVEELRHIFEAAGVKHGARVVTYCRTGVQSSMDYFVAKYLGYPVSMYPGSFFEWSRTDAPVEVRK